MEVPEGINKKARESFLSLWSLSLFCLLQMASTEIYSLPKSFLPKSKKEEGNKLVKKSRFLAIIVTISLTGIFGLTVNQTQAVDEVPLPRDINIVPPSPNLPKEIVAFSEKWGGNWMMGRVSRTSVLKFLSIRPPIQKRI
jgi:hypothetical protein